jgi:hypothetical protein
MDGSATHRRRAGRQRPLALERLEDRSVFAGPSSFGADSFLIMDQDAAAFVRVTDQSAHARDGSTARSVDADTGVLPATGAGMGGLNGRYLVSLSRDLELHSSTGLVRQSDYDDAPAGPHQSSSMETPDRDERLAARRDALAVPADQVAPRADAADIRAVDVRAAAPARPVSLALPVPKTAAAATAGVATANRPVSTAGSGKAGEPPPRLVVNPHRPDRVEPRVRKWRPKQYPLMTRPRQVLREALLRQNFAA